MVGKIIKIAVFSLLTIMGVWFFKESYRLLMEENERYLTIKGIDERVIEKLKIGRDLQLHYLAVKGEYAPNWDSLFNFVRHGQIFTVQETQIIEASPYGDKLIVERDTVGVVEAYDSLKNRIGGIALKDIESLKFAPGHPEDKPVEFVLEAGEAKGTATFQISDPEPLNPKRSVSPDDGEMPALKVGSMSAPSIRGNWEY